MHVTRMISAFDIQMRNASIRYTDRLKQEVRLEYDCFYEGIHTNKKTELLNLSETLM